MGEGVNAACRWCAIDQFESNRFSVVLAQREMAPLTHDVRGAAVHLRIYVYAPSPLYIYIFTRSHPQIYLSTSTLPHIGASISHIGTFYISFLLIF